MSDNNELKTGPEGAMWTKYETILLVFVALRFIGQLVADVLMYLRSPKRQPFCFVQPCALVDKAANDALVFGQRVISEMHGELAWLSSAKVTDPPPVKQDAEYEPERRVDTVELQRRFRGWLEQRNLKITCERIETLPGDDGHYTVVFGNVPVFKDALGDWRFAQVRVPSESWDRLHHTIPVDCSGREFAHFLKKMAAEGDAVELAS